MAFNCTSCGREETDCSRNPCEAVIADREAAVAAIKKTEKLGRAYWEALLELDRLRDTIRKQAYEIAAYRESAA